MLYRRWQVFSIRFTNQTQKQENAAQKQEKALAILKWIPEYIIIIAAIEEKVNYLWRK